MKQSITESDFVAAFKRIRPDNFSYSGLSVLWDFFEQLEDATGEEMELDVIAICCEYAEDDYETIKDNYQIPFFPDVPLDFDDNERENYYNSDDYKEALKECVTEYLENHTVFIGDVDGACCIYAQF